MAADVPGRWVAATSPDYFEPRMFLITQIMDESRHLDVFRKRALANGGGLMQRPNVTTSGVVGSIDLSRDFTEMSSRLHISGEGAVLTIFRMGEFDGVQRGGEENLSPGGAGRVSTCGVRSDAYALSGGRRSLDARKRCTSISTRANARW